MRIYINVWRSEILWRGRRVFSVKFVYREARLGEESGNMSNVWGVCEILTNRVNYASEARGRGYIIRIIARGTKQILMRERERELLEETLLLINDKSREKEATML